MDEREYHRQADAALQALQTRLDELDAELDYELAEGGILQIEFDDGSKIVVNKQAAAQEIWVAARRGGFHYRWDGQAWRDTRTGEELMQALSAMLSEQAGTPIQLA